MSRRKKWLRRLLVTVGVLVLLFFVGRFAVNYRTQSRLDAIIAELDRTDPGWRFDEILMAKEKNYPPDADNIFLVTEKLLNPAEPEAYQEFTRTAGDWTPPLTGPNLPAEAKLAAARKARDDCKPIIDELRTIKGKTRGGFRVTVTPVVIDLDLSHAQRLRNAAGMLALDAVVSAADKDGDRAVGSAHAVLDSGKAIEGDCWLIEALIRSAMSAVAASEIERILGWSEPTAGLAELQAAFLAEADYPSLYHGMRGERGMGDKIFTNMANGTAGAIGPPGGMAGRFVTKPLIYENHAAYLEYMTAQLAAAKLPPHERAAAQAKIPEPDPRDWRQVFLRLLLPAVQKMHESDQRRLARLRTAAVALACERHRRAVGTWPTTLADIRKDILPTVPLDPYDGKPLRLFRAEDGLVIYSVGPDGADNGGTLTRTYRVDEKGVDYGHRLWDVSRRRAEPLPVTDEETK